MVIVRDPEWVFIYLFIVVIIIIIIEKGKKEKEGRFGCSLVIHVEVKGQFWLVSSLLPLGSWG